MWEDAVKVGQYGKSHFLHTFLGAPSRWLSNRKSRPAKRARVGRVDQPKQAPSSKRENIADRRCRAKSEKSTIPDFATAILFEWHCGNGVQWLTTQSVRPADQR